MPTQIRHHDYPLAPERLDDYLRSGWRPAGQAIYTSDFLRTDSDEIYGCIQVRLPLRGFVFKKRHRKLLRRNAARFRVEYAKATVPDAALLDLNRRYMVANPDRSREDLTLHVTGEYGWRALDTRIVRVYDGGTLVAFSYFDLGRDTAYTKAGIYDPEYARYSLGIYTMLLEIEWLIANGRKYYHPGYVVPRYPLFDYKLQFGAVEYRDIRSGKWLPYDHDAAEDPYKKVEEALEALRKVLDPERETTALLEYASFTARFHYETADMNLLDEPLLVYLGRTVLLGDLFVVIFRLETERYELLRAQESHLRDIKVRPFNDAGRRRAVIPLEVLSVKATAATPEEMAAIVAAQRFI